MQTTLVKRSLISFLESVPVEKNIEYQEPQKKLKTALKIEITDSYDEEAQPLPISTSHASHTKFSFRTPLGSQTCKASTSSSPQFNDRRSLSFDFGRFVPEVDTMYDNFYKEEDFYNVTMRKCHRRHMEDRAICETSFETPVKSSFFGIYDGHRNSYVSDFLQRNLHKSILSHPNLLENPEKTLKDIFYRIDQDVCKNQERLNIQGGSTALCAVVRQNEMFLANTGDSKAVVVREGRPFTLNVEHRATNEEEKRCVENRGGTVFEKKGQATSRFLVQGSLELTRSIGDLSYKQYITCEPDVYQYKFDHNDEYIILGSDGFWNELNEEETMELTKAYGKSKGLSKFLVEEAMKRKHYNIDNITLIVIDLKKYMEKINNLHN